MYCRSLAILYFCVSFFLTPGSVLSQNSTSFSYSQLHDGTTSAGVYKADCTLVRTLWSGVKKTAGLYSTTWDGKLDDLTTNAPAGNYYVKVQSNNIQTTWEGVIGNTSDALTGETVHRQFLPFMDMCIVGNSAYVCADFAEREGSTYRIDLTDPQKKHDVQQGSLIQQKTDRLCSDGTRLYMGGNETQHHSQTYVQAATFAQLGNYYDGYLPFQGATVQTLGQTFRACDVVNNGSRITGMAVQQSGNYLFVARRNNNSIHVVTKPAANNTGGGVLVQDLTFTLPTLLTIDVDDNLWIARNNGTIVEKYMVNSSTGALTSTGITITGLTSVQGMDISGTTIAIADAGTYHQVKGYSTLTGALSWTLGRAESYSTSATIYNDKFYFTDQRNDPDAFTFITYQSDGSLWVGDKRNCRYLKFNSNRVYQTQIAFLPHFWSSYVDPNNPSRVFADYLEYTVDYSKPIQVGNANGAWQLVKNWGFNVTTNQDSDYDRVKTVTTLSNGRTYAVSNRNDGTNDDPRYYSWEIVELVSGGTLRYTGVTFPRYENYQFRPNGDIIGFEYEGPGVVWKKKTLTGFDGSNNPTYSAFAAIASSVPDPPTGGSVARPAEITGSDMIVAFHASIGGGYHLAGIPVGGTSYKWKTAKTVNSNWGDPYPATGEYEIGMGTQYAGSTALAMDSIIIWGNRGEFYANGQTNIWNIVSDKGLFLKQFGTITAPYPTPQAQAEMAGNAFKPSLVKVNGVYYLWHNDESYHGGLHRWKITGMNTIQEQTIPINNFPALNFQSKTSGDWNDVNTWQSSTDTITWVNATQIPSLAAQSITILNGHSINISNAVTVDQLVIRNGGFLKVMPNATLIVNDGIGDDITIAPSGSIVIKSDSTGTGRIGNSSGVISGNVTVERYINSVNRKSYRLLAPSVNTANSTKPFIRDNWQEGQNNTSSTNNNAFAGFGIHITGSTTGVNGFDATGSASPSLSTYNTVAGSSAWVPIANTNASSLETKKGYLVYIRGDRSTDLNTNATSSNTTLRATGTIAAGTQHFTNQAGNGKTSLVTNPYACPVNWNTIYNDLSLSNRGNFENFYNYWDPSVGTSGGYVTVTTSGTKSAVTNATVEIQSGQAFFIKAKRGTVLPTFTIKESHKSATDNLNLFRTGAQEQFGASLYFTATDGSRTMADAINAIFDTAFSAAIDGDDAEEMENIDENIAILRDGIMLSIEGRPLINTTDTLPLAVQRLKVQNYQWQFDPSNFGHPNIQAYLEDKYLHIRTPINLTTVTIIPFSVNADPASAATDRFKVIFAPNRILPVTIRSLKAYQKGTGIQVDWITEHESNVDRYEIEKSVNGQQFTKGGIVKAHPNSNLTNNYNWLDIDPNEGNNYYRIKEVDKTGSVHYSSMVNVNISGKKESFEVFPNPVIGNFLNIHFNSIPEGTYVINLVSNNGQQVFSRTITHPGGSASEIITLNANLPSGIYNLQIVGKGVSFNMRMVK